MQDHLHPTTPEIFHQLGLLADVEPDRSVDAPATGTQHAAAVRARLLDVRRIWHQPGAIDTPTGRAVLDRFPTAELVEVPSHWNIPGLHGNPGNVEHWLRVKREELVLGLLGTPRVRPNGRSADFIAPSLANGCTMSCAYCYVPRRKGYANPVTVFANPEASLAAVARHLARTGPKREPTQCHPTDWVYDIGENSDCSVDAAVSPGIREVVEGIAALPGARPSFATKLVNRDLLSWDVSGGGGRIGSGASGPRAARIRFSLMPADTARLLDVLTDPIETRIAAIDEFVAAGWEVHLNFSPVVVHAGWTARWAELLQHLSDVLGPAARAQARAEVIFLTHNEALHEVNLGWHPRAEELLWTPQWQEQKRSENGQLNVRYRRGAKAELVRRFRELVAEHAPWCAIRYAF